ncbi:MAG: hypothetical protein QOF35_1718, partial [Actinomycetota bacterium]|nr:hypothetical protein [Actinomycetota bacterium]
MTIWTCATCGIEHPDSAQPPAFCAICEDERQYVPATGQRWTTQQELAGAGHRTRVELLEPDLYAVVAEPRVGIGQRGLLLRTAAGNLLWEPPGLIDEAGIDALRGLGGVSIVSASHPHLTGASIQWSHAFDGVPVLVASADRQWIRRPDRVIELWSGTREILPGVTFVQCGGHFAGSSVTHWAAGAEGRGALLTGDTVAPGADRKSVHVMRSYVNMIPVPERAVRRIAEVVEPYAYDRIYGGFSQLDSGAKTIVAATLARYIA